MRTLVASSASFLFGVALSVGDFKAPQIVADSLLLAGALGYLYVFVTWEPMRQRLARTFHSYPVGSLIAGCLVIGLLLLLGWRLLPYFRQPPPVATAPIALPPPKPTERLPTATEIAKEIAKESGKESPKSEPPRRVIAKFSSVLSKENARIAITDIRAYLPPRTPFPAFTFYFANNGQEATTGLLHDTKIVITENENALTREETDKYQSQLARLNYFEMPGDVPRAPVLEVYPRESDTMLRFYTFPDRTGHDADVLSLNMPEILSGTKIVYVLNVLKYRDKTMRAGLVGVTEGCVYFTQQLRIWHVCGRNRSFIEPAKQP